MTAPRLPVFDLSGRVALVTGAAGLLGREHCTALAECGAHVVLTDLGAAAVQAAARLREEMGQDAFTGLTMDVTDPASIRTACDHTVSRHGGVHILINNAAIDPKVKADGGLREASRLENFSLEDWQLHVDVGLTGAFLCSQVFGTWMAEHGGGVILNIASDLSVIAPDQRLYRKPGVPEDRQPVKPVTYSVIKTGLIGLTRYLAAYWAQSGVRVNALSPGGIYAGQPEEFVQRLATLIPMGRMAARDEYRAAVQFLCSDASRYLTGQNIVMDGGRSVL
jgi:NAD(P)-dependent dehydrogenase (short-subunit alcohol dehydrogenase family)